MTEAEWAVCQDPERMLAYLRRRASDRKLRLFSVACVRRVWHRLEDKTGRLLVEKAEAFADGQATRRQLSSAAGRLSRRLDEWYERRRSPPGLLLLVINVAWDDSHNRSASVRDLTLECRKAGDPPAAQAALLRCIIGNPWHPISLDPAVLATQGGTVFRMAASIYEERKWLDMPVLGDALEDAGVTDQAVLGHCRGKGPGPHARGCHVVDLILGKS